MPRDESPVPEDEEEEEYSVEKVVSVFELICNHFVAKSKKKPFIHTANLFM